MSEPARLHGTYLLVRKSDGTTYGVEIDEGWLVRGCGPWLPDTRPEVILAALRRGDRALDSRSPGCAGYLAYLQVSIADHHVVRLTTSAREPGRLCCEPWTVAGVVAFLALAGGVLDAFLHAWGLR